VKLRASGINDLTACCNDVLVRPRSAARRRPRARHALTQRVRAAQTSIVQNVALIPYGVRWICKQLAVLCKERFPDADRNQIGCGCLRCRPPRPLPR
jgi:hypothetical protein